MNKSLDAECIRCLKPQAKSSTEIHPFWLRAAGSMVSAQESDSKLRNTLRYPQEFSLERADKGNRL